MPAPKLACMDPACLDWDEECSRRNPHQATIALKFANVIPSALFFQAPASKSPPSGRLLLISFHFPPGGGAGALRWQKLAQFAGERGQTLDVITLHPSDLDKIDNKRLADLPPGTRIYGVPMPALLLERIEGLLLRCLRWFRRGSPAARELWESGAALRATAHVRVTARPSEALHDRIVQRFRQVLGAMRRGYFACMDYYTHGAWADDATRLGLRLLASEKYDAIITCGPPHMAHEAGRRLAQRTELPLVVDLRDPWSMVQRLADVFDSALWYRLATFYERRVVARASLIVMNTTPAQNAMRALYPSKQSRIIAVMNGYDEEASCALHAERKFIIAYAGAVYLDRDPRVLLKSVARVVSSLGLTPGEIGLEFMGHVESYQCVSLRSLADAEGIADYVRILGPSPRDAALEFLSHASVLVSLPQDSDMAIPSKIFEYMQFEAWILAIALRGSATELLLRDSGANVVAPDDLEGMTEALMSRFRQHRQGTRPARLAASMSFASRRAQAALLFDALDEVVRSGQPGRTAIGTEVA